jgi:nucleoid-associated protein YgaU
MAAIQSPRESVEWSVVPAAAQPPAHDQGIDPPQASERVAVRRLPDRATRIRRRRLAVLVVAVVVLSASALGTQALRGLTSVGGSSQPRPVEVRAVPVAGQQYVVQPGDTLWSIATEIAPDADPRAVVDALRAANGGPELEVGSRLTLDLH